METVDIDGNCYVCVGLSDKWILISGPLHQKLLTMSAGSYAPICIPHKSGEHKWERIGLVEHHNVLTGYICDDGILPPPSALL